MVCCLLAGCGVCDCCRLFGFVWLVFGVYIWLFTVADVTMVLGLEVCLLELVLVVWVW